MNEYNEYEMENIRGSNDPHTETSDATDKGSKKKKAKEKLPEITYPQRIIMNGLPKLISSQDREVIPVCGQPGSGKSALINYLLGCEMQEVEAGYFKGKTDVTGVPYTRVGHS